MIQWIVQFYLQGGGQELLQFSSLFLYIFCSLLRQLTTIKNTQITIIVKSNMMHQMIKTGMCLKGCF